MPTLDLILYSHPGCCLCDRLEEMLAPHLAALRLRHGGVNLLKRDIADDPAWHELYHDRIPVLVAGEEVILEGRPEEEEIEAAMQRIARLL